MRVQSVVLEHHCDISVLRSNIVCELIADVKLTLADLFEACDHSKRGGLTAAGRTNENDELLVFDVQAEICNSGNAAGIDFIDIFKCYTCHKIFPPDDGLLYVRAWQPYVTNNVSFQCIKYSRKSGL